MDLLDPRELTPFARRGVRSVLFWMIALVIFSLFWLAPASGRSNVVGFALLVTVAACGLGFPLVAAHSRIRREKEDQLQRIRAEIRADQAGLLAGGAAAAGPAARLPALYAAEARVRSASAWPFDADTRLRFILYLTLGLGSWLGAALVERLLGAALG